MAYPPHSPLAAVRTGIILPISGSFIILGAEFVLAASVRPAHWAIWGFDLGLSVIAASILLIGLSYRWKLEAAPLATVLNWLQRPWRYRLTPALLLGLFQGTIVFSVAVLTLALSFDNRSRDIPTVLMVLPVLACCLIGIRASQRQNFEASKADFLRPEAWLGGFLIFIGILSLIMNAIMEKAAGNMEAYVWALIVFLAAIPLWLRLNRCRAGPR
ncbi:MAG: hypothetical protein R3E60_01035 [Alphaproteobacteria bacterium]